MVKELKMNKYLAKDVKPNYDKYPEVEVPGYEDACVAGWPGDSFRPGFDPGRSGVPHYSITDSLRLQAWQQNSW